MSRPLSPIKAASAEIAEQAWKAMQTGFPLQPMAIEDIITRHLEPEILYFEAIEEHRQGKSLTTLSDQQRLCVEQEIPL